MTDWTHEGGAQEDGAQVGGAQVGGAQGLLKTARRTYSVYSSQI